MLRYLIIFLSLHLASCQTTDNNPYPEISQPQKVSIAYLRSLYSGSVTAISENIYIEGYLMSNDYAGNFYHSLILQDDTGGIEISIDLDDSHKTFTTFAPYTVNCQGLYLGGSSDNIKLGAYSGYYYVTDIPEVLISSYISVCSEPSSDLPTMPRLTISELNDRYLSCYVYLYNAILQGTTLTDKTTLQPMELYISSYSDFYGHDLSSDNCSIVGIIDKGDGAYFIIPNSDFDIAL